MTSERLLNLATLAIEKKLVKYNIQEPSFSIIYRFKFYNYRIKFISHVSSLIIKKYNYTKQSQIHCVK